MTIETKYNIGDEVWVIFEHKAKCATINSIRVYNDSYITNEYGETVDSVIRILYCFPHGIWVDEENIFHTKEELLKSL